jgi:membrane protease YdiL (CAAX protease family)
MHFLERALDNTNHFWKYVLIAVIFFLSANLIGGIPLIVVMITQTVKMGGIPPDFAANMDFTLLGISQNAGLLLMLIPFAVALFFCILFVKILHSRSFSETVNGTKKVRWSHAFVGFGVWFLLMLIYLLVFYAIDPGNFVIQFDIKTFLPLLLISVLFIPLQTTCEEFLFRGYLTQGVGAWTKNRWLAIIIPAILFALMHIANPEVSEFGFWGAMPQYLIFGLIFGLTAVLDDGIELAIGMHAANNIFASLFVTFDASALSTPAIFHQQTMHVGIETIVLAILGILAVMFFAWKYKWNFRIMNQKVEPLPMNEVDKLV